MIFLGQLCDEQSYWWMEIELLVKEALLKSELHRQSNLLIIVAVKALMNIKINSFREWDEKNLVAINICSGPY